MPKAGVVPNCRYGHGDLEPPKIPDQLPQFGVFALPGLHIKRTEAGERYIFGDGGLLLDIFECPTCGYTELFERAKTS